MPIGASGGRCVYRKSWVNEAGYDEIPADLDGFLDLCQKLKTNGHPPASHSATRSATATPGATG